MTVGERVIADFDSWLEGHLGAAQVVRPREILATIIAMNPTER